MSRIVSSLLLLSWCGSLQADYLYVKIDLSKISELLTPIKNDQQPQPMMQPSSDGQPMAPTTLGDLSAFITASSEPKWVGGMIELKSNPDVKNAPTMMYAKVGEAPKFYMMIPARAPLAGSKAGAPLMIPYYINLENAALQYPGMVVTAADKKSPPKLTPIPHPIPAKEYEQLFRVKTEFKDKSADGLLGAAVWALERGLQNEFHAAMKALGDLPTKHPVLARYRTVKEYFGPDKKKSALPDDPAWKSLVTKQTGAGFKLITSEPGRYAGITSLPSGFDALLKRRLARLEELNEQFHYWCALQTKMPALKLPRVKSLVILVKDEEEFSTVAGWFGRTNVLGDAIVSTRHNVIVLNAKRTDEGAELAAEIQKIWTDASGMLQRDKHLVEGKIWDNEFAELGFNARAVLQLLGHIHKQSEEEWENATLTREGMKLILTGAGLLPRNVDLPHWLLAGLASYFESPGGCSGAGIGRLGTTNLSAFRVVRDRRLGTEAEILRDLLADRYWLESETLAMRKELAKAREQEETGRTLAWSFWYNQFSDRGPGGQIRKLEPFVLFREQLLEFPRDLDLAPSEFHPAFAKAFSIGDASLEAKGFADLAGSWLDAMKSQSLDVPVCEEEYMRQRAQKAREKKAP